MNFSTSALEIFRVLINDLDESDYEYSDEALLRVLYASAYYVNKDVGGSYTISFCNQTVSPTPTDDFIQLAALKAACILAKSIHSQYSKNNFKVSDGPTSIDLSGAASELAKAAKNNCEEYLTALRSSILTSGGLGASTPNSDC